jgi:hypothetical protein
LKRTQACGQSLYKSPPSRTIIGPLSIRAEGAVHSLIPGSKVKHQTKAGAASDGNLNSVFAVDLAYFYAVDVTLISPKTLKSKHIFKTEAWSSRKSVMH